MNIKSEKGITAINIATAVVILFIFVSIIATIIYSANSLSRELEIEAKATEYAVAKIEDLKNQDFERYFMKAENAKQEEKLGDNGQFTRKVTIQDYKEIDPNVFENILKIVTVRVAYRFQGTDKSVELSTTVSRDSN